MPKKISQKFILPLTFLLFFVIVAGLMYYMYTDMRRTVTAHLQDELKRLTSISARNFSEEANAIQRIHSKVDMTLPEYKRLVQDLQIIRYGYPDIRFAYIMRKTDDPNTLEFVADADSLSSKEDLDRNQNGTIDADEEPSFPGDKYDISTTPAMQGPAFEGPTTDEKFSQDSWGTWVSGYAPIFDSKGNAIAILGVDMSASSFTRVADKMLPLMYLLIGFIFLFSIISCIALYSIISSQDLAEEIAREMTKKYREANLLLENIVRYLPVALFCKDVKDEYRFILWNNKSQELFGLSREKAIGKNDYDFFSKEQADNFRKVDADVMKGGKVVDIPRESVGAGDAAVDVHTIKVPIMDETGKPRYLLGISELPCEHEK